MKKISKEKKYERNCEEYWKNMRKEKMGRMLEKNDKETIK